MGGPGRDEMPPDGVHDDGSAYRQTASGEVNPGYAGPYPTQQESGAYGPSGIGRDAQSGGQNEWYAQPYHGEIAEFLGRQDGGAFGGPAPAPVPPTSGNGHAGHGLGHWDPGVGAPGAAGNGTGPGNPGHGGSGRGGHAGPPAGGTGSPSSGNARRRRAVRRRSFTTLIGPLAGALGLAILLGAGVYALADSRKCADDTIQLKIAAAPEIAPAISEITSSFNADRHSVDHKCVQAVVRVSDPAGMSTLLSGTGSAPGEINPDVWIPDSSLWVTLVHSTPGGASRVFLTPTTVAETPLVVATSRAFATKIRRDGIQPTWDTLLKATDALATGAASEDDVLAPDSVHLKILDPNRNAAGIGAIVMIRMLLQGDPNANAIFTQLVRSVQSRLSPTRQALFATFQEDLHGLVPALIAPEQAVWRYNQSHPSDPGGALYPGEGVLNLDYPFTLTTENTAKVRAAALLEQAMATPRAVNAVRALGFRTSDGRPGDGFAAHGLNPRIPRTLPPPATGDVTDVMQAWTRLSLRTRMLVLYDVSGSMAQPVGNGLTRMQATAQVAQGGLGNLPDDTDLGLWTFSTNMNGRLPYRTEVPIGPLSTRLGSGTRRQAMLSAFGRLRPKPKGNTGLYDSVLASVRSLRKSYKPGYVNTVLVLTDGKNDNPRGISLSGLLEALKHGEDPDRPVNLFFIGFGPDVDMAAMQKIAEQANGQAYQAFKPQDVQRILLDAISRRICTPSCH